MPACVPASARHRAVRLWPPARRSPRAARFRLPASRPCRGGVVRRTAPAPTAPSTALPPAMPSGHMPAVSGQGAASTSYPLRPDTFALELSPDPADHRTQDRPRQGAVVPGGQQGAVRHHGDRAEAQFPGGPPMAAWSTTANAPYAASEWLTVSPIRASPCSRVQVQVVTAKVTVPKPIPTSGTTSASDLPRAEHRQPGANIKINRGIAAPIFIAVPGPQDNTVTLAGFRSPHFVTGGPVTGAPLKSRTSGPCTATSAASPRCGSAAPVRPRPSRTSPWCVVPCATSPPRGIPPFLCVCHPSVTIANAEARQTMTIQVIVLPAARSR